MSIYSTVDYLHAEGERDGRQRGHLEGASRQASKLLLRFGKRTLGPPTDDQRTQIHAMGDTLDLEQLDKLLDDLANAPSWSDLLSKATVPRQAPPSAPDYLLPIEFDPTRIGPSIDQYASVSMRTGEKAIIHLRFQRMYQSGLGEVLYKESLRLRDKYQCQPITLLTLLWPGADGPDITGEFRSGKEVYRYQVTRVWEKDVEELFGDPRMAVFAPLARFAPERLPEVIRSTSQAISAFPDKEKQGDFWSMLYTCMGLIYPAERVHELVPHLLPLMRTRPEGRGTLSKGYYAGFSAGLAEGALATTRRLLLDVGSARVSPPTPEIRRVLDAMTNLERLEQVAARVRTATSWQEALAPG